MDQKKKASDRVADVVPTTRLFSILASHHFNPLRSKLLLVSALSLCCLFLVLPTNANEWCVSLY